MGKKDFWHEIISLYKSKGSIHERIESALNLVNQVIPCQSCSIFFFDEYAGSLQLEAGTNVKEGLSIPNFRSDSPLWRMFESDEPSRVSDKQLKGEYPTTDVFFENVSTVKSIAFSPISDEKNNKIGLIRLLNRTTEENEVRNFYENDLINLSFFANAFGVLLTISTLRNKYEAFLDSVTHELLAPVSGIKNAGILVRRMAGDPDGEKFKEAKELFN
jgi:hypothetical protein